MHDARGGKTKRNPTSHMLFFSFAAAVFLCRLAPAPAGSDRKNIELAPYKQPPPQPTSQGGASPAMLNSLREKGYKDIKQRPVFVAMMLCVLDGPSS